MRTLSDPLKSEQRRPSRRPLVKLEVATYGHPSAVADSDLQWMNYSWARLNSTSDTTPVGYHGLAIPGDGSVNRIRVYSGSLYHQRVTNPSGSSNWLASWTNLGGVVGQVAIAARSSSVVVFCGDGTYLYRRESSDNGATWGSWVVMSNARPCERGCAAAFKSNGDLAVVHASDVNDPTSLYIQKRVSGTWSTGYGQITGDYPIYSLALYHDGDWNILALMLDGSYVRLARAVYGDGVQYSVGTFSGFEFINSYKAKVDFTGQMALRQWRSRRSMRSPTYYEQYSAVMEERGVDNLGVDDPFICYHSSLGACFSFSKDNRPWFYLLRPGTQFKDSDWYRAFPLETTASYGLAVACDGTYLYATSPDQVWRTSLPGSWSPPTAGSGAGIAYTVPSADILSVREKVESLSVSTLEVILDNSKGTYNTPGAGSNSLIASLKRGSEVSLSIGYRRASSDLLSLANKYYIESMGYKYRPGEAHFIIRCIDAWGLLELFSFNRPVEWNSSSNEFTVYALVEKVLQAVGGSLSYRSRSTEIVSLYPLIRVHAGQSGASVLRHLLSLVPDVIYFCGLTGYIVYPQSDDQPTYMFKNP